MKYRIKNKAALSRILWVDAVMGGGTALIGLGFNAALTPFLGLPSKLIMLISLVTLAYAIVAFVLALQSRPSMRMLKVLMFANWFWAVISIAMLAVYISGATVFGAAFLVLQVFVVGGLAYLEGQQIEANIDPATVTASP